MDLPPPDSRECDSCLNTMTLNLFPLDSPKCRYCENGVDVPKRLTNKISTAKTGLDSSSQISLDSGHEQTHEQKVDTDTALISKDTISPVEEAKPSDNDGII